MISIITRQYPALEYCLVMTLCVCECNIILVVSIWTLNLQFKQNDRKQAASG